ncbi:hypothetical protein FJ656_00785 [Schumannella luteola]|uniref:Uncharacterized protein n=1 Tax=Schumannella luteola TaxID=472059 RepID=A0A852YPT5_9MICO|nr:hypothetical protein [Schumannella luteola]NYG99739.1 hypothetical protein [Schumannella luteola]TPX06518.1 hypothetical protein FJ656_00785 [Schumannella luteola]
MTIPHYDQTVLTPLDSDALVLRRAEELIGQARRDQLWLLLLDRADVQLPVLLPIDDLPSEPDELASEGFAGVFRMLRTETEARAVVAVLERPALTTLPPGDRAWIRALHEAATVSGLRLRASLLAGAQGLRWIAPDDWA